jgi:hypothetical protein
MKRLQLLLIVALTTNYQIINTSVEDNCKQLQEDFNNVQHHYSFLNDDPQNPHASTTAEKMSNNEIILCYKNYLEKKNPTPLDSEQLDPEKPFQTLDDPYKPTGTLQNPSFMIRKNQSNKTTEIRSLTSPKIDEGFIQFCSKTTPEDSTYTTQTNIDQSQYIIKQIEDNIQISNGLRTLTKIQEKTIAQEVDHSLGVSTRKVAKSETRINLLFPDEKSDNNLN